MSKDFVMEILKRLKINVDFKGPLGAFLKNLREKGKCEMEFPMDDNFREKFKIAEKKVKFATHEELDKFVKKLCSVDVEFELKYKQEWAMLKR